MRGLEYAIKLGWFDYKNFNVNEYDHYERVENGDLNWIIPNKFIAFSSPSQHDHDNDGVITLLFRMQCIPQPITFLFSKNSMLEQLSD